MMKWNRCVSITQFDDYMQIFAHLIDCGANERSFTTFRRQCSSLVFRALINQLDSAVNCLLLKTWIFLVASR